MAHWDNLQTRQIQQEQDEAYANGLADGFDTNVNHLPEWWHKTSCARLTPYMRGYFVGRELKIEELRSAREA